MGAAVAVWLAAEQWWRVKLCGCQCLDKIAAIHGPGLKCLQGGSCGGGGHGLPNAAVGGSLPVSGKCWSADI